MQIRKKILYISLLLALTGNNIQAQKPNIIFILADDLGYGDLGCYGQTFIKTPNLDKLAQDGLKLTQFYSGSTVCAPARASFMTGLHTGHTPVRGNKTFAPEGQFPMPDSSVTIAMELKKAGYQTAAIGKWSLGYITTSGAPAKKGFDDFFGYNCQSLAHNYYPDHIWHNDEKIMLTGNKNGNEVYSADLFQQQALSFINEQDGGQPFFLYLPYTLPHVDLIPPHDSIYQYYLDLFQEESLPETDKRNLNKYAVELHPHAAYAAMVARLDRYVGEIVAAVKEKGIEENTLIIFTSDNGPHKEKGGDPAFFKSSGIYRGIKRDLYEGGIREPMIMQWKGTITPGQESNHIAALWDLFPTFQQLAGRPVTHHIDGISIVPLLKQQRQPLHPYLYWELHESGGKQAVRWKKWKAVKLDVSTGNVKPIELYNLRKDPSETTDLASKNKRIVKRLEAIMHKAHRKNPDWLLFPNE